MVDTDEIQRKLEALREMGNRAESTDFAAMHEQIGALRTTATSQDRAVTVEAGPGGSVTDIRFTQDALKLTASQLSSTVMATLRSAVADSARSQAEIVQAHVPEGDVLNRVLAAQQPEKPPERGAPAEDDFDEVPDSFLDDGRR